MSESIQPAAENRPPRNVWLSVLAGLGFILLFLLILWLAYLPYRPEPIAEVQAQQRMETYNEIKNDSSELTSTYGVVNEEEGIYRIPVDEAMKLTVEKYRREDSVPGTAN
mgnify:FL=1|jgi:hypothetical protein